MDAYYLACKEHEEQIPPEIYQGVKLCKARVPEK